MIQQGRCTLVTMLQIYKILGINCLVNAMVLSNLFLHGVKQGDRQLTILGMAVAALFFFVTRAERRAITDAFQIETAVVGSLSSSFGIHCFAVWRSFGYHCFGYPSCFGISRPLGSLFGAGRTVQSKRFKLLHFYAHLRGDH
jgi:magnesium-transporting ATPase (P-type)